MSVRNAARQIVAATRRGETEIILSPPAQLLARLRGMFPGLTTEVLGAVNRLLPEPGGVGTQRRLGKESETPISQSILTTLGRRAAHTWHQYPESENPANATE